MMSNVLDQLLAGKVLENVRQINKSIGFLTLEANALKEPGGNCSVEEATSFVRTVISYCELEVRISANYDLCGVKIGSVNTAIDAHQRISELCCCAEQLCAKKLQLDFQRMLQKRLREIIPDL